MPGDLRDELLQLATAPERRMDQVLRRALEALAGRAGANAAALLVLDPAEIRPHLVAAASWGRVGTPPPRFFDRWTGGGEGRLAQACGYASAEPAPERRLDLRLLPPGATLGSTSRSSLWLPLVEHHRGVALLVLESDRAESFPEPAIQELQRIGQEVLPGLQRALLRSWLEEIGGPTDVIGNSRAFLDLERQIRITGMFADGAVLITGERGCGKELVAWAVHAWSRRRRHPFVPLLAAASAETLTADELFGHERNSFTGAAESRRGKLEMADGGTLLLDEAGDLPASAQAAFLRVLERGELQRIGRDAPLRVDVRVVAATNRDLDALMADGRFRHDLYDRLSFFEIQVPPLRERVEDIPLLARHFLQSACARTWRHRVLDRKGLCCSCGPTAPTGCTTDGFERRLEGYRWPGNVRELRHTMERLAATVPDSMLDLHHLPSEVQEVPHAEERGEDVSWSLDGAIRRHIEKTLRHTGSNQSQAARLLGLPLSTLRSKMKRLGISA